MGGQSLEVMKRSRVWILGVAIALVFALSGCGQSGTASPSASAASSSAASASTSSAASTSVGSDGVKLSGDSSDFVLLSEAVPDAMLANGFKPIDTEWWHFTLENEPYPDTYFTFPVNSDSVSGK